MSKTFSYYLSKFLKDHLIIERNMSSNTVRSYKNTFQQLIDYLVNIQKFKITEIDFSKITQEIILEFLEYLEENKKNTERTRNQRLACIKSFYRYCLINEVENIDTINKILAIKFKKYTKKLIDYLTEEELQEVFNNIDKTSKKGRRNLTILVLLYDTAARASELINLRLEDVHLEEKYIILTGKGNKQRIVPIMKETVNLVYSYLQENNINKGYVIQNKSHNVMSSYFLQDMIKKYTKNFDKNITPHTFRHTRAIHLLNAGVPLIYIRDVLGHKSIVTTEEYAKVLNNTKFEIIEKATKPVVQENFNDWVDDQDLLSQLLNL